MRLLSLLVVSLSIAACASAKNGGDGKPTPAREIVSGGAQLTGGGKRMTVTVGRAFRQEPMSSSAATAVPASVVTP